LSGRPPTGELKEGWYLMSVADLESELARWRHGEARAPSHALRLSIAEALEYRDAGNVPDELGRSLRLVLTVDDENDLRSLDAKRLRYEPDYHDPPKWRRRGSVAVNVVPLGREEVARDDAAPWWEDAPIAELESEWQERGTIAGVAVPAQYRGFVYKTVLSLRALGKEVSAESLANSIARWVPRHEAEEIRRALEEANSSPRA
jgi:hypothetical protein